MIGCTFFFVSVLSSPIKKTVCFSNVTTADGAKVVDFGLFGACWREHRGFPYMCTPRGLGWQLDSARLGGFAFPERTRFKLLKLSRGLISDVVVLVLAGLSSSFWTTRWITNMRIFRIVSAPLSSSWPFALLYTPSRPPPFIRVLQDAARTSYVVSASADAQPAIVFYILAIPAAFIAWGHNIATAVYVRDIMRWHTGGEYVGHYGNAVWLTLAGTVSARGPTSSQPHA